MKELKKARIEQSQHKHTHTKNKCFAINTENFQVERLNTHARHLHTRNRHNDANGKYKSILSRLVYANGSKKKLFSFYLCVVIVDLFLCSDRVVRLSLLWFYSVCRVKAEEPQFYFALVRHTDTHAHTHAYHCHVSICSTVDEDDDYDDSHRYSSARSVSWWHSTRTVCIHHHHRHRLELPFHISLDFLSTLSEESRVFYHQLVLFLFATNRFGFILFKQEFDSPCDLLLLHVSDQEKKIKFQWRRKNSPFGQLIFIAKMRARKKAHWNLPSTFFSTDAPCCRVILLLFFLTNH